MLKRVILSRWPDNKQCTPQCIHHFWVVGDELSVCGNVIFKGCQILIPKSERPIILTRIQASHLGVESCLRKAKYILFWPQMSQDIQNYVSQYEVCNELKPNQTKELMQFHKIPERPWSKIVMDVFSLPYITVTILLQGGSKVIPCERPRTDLQTEPMVY